MIFLLLLRLSCLVIKDINLVLLAIIAAVLLSLICESAAVFNFIFILNPFFTKRFLRINFKWTLFNFCRLPHDNRIAWNLRMIQFWLSLSPIIQRLAQKWSDLLKIHYRIRKQPQKSCFLFRLWPCQFFYNCKIGGC